jgi:multiple sugar transport system permease protein
MMMPYYVRKRLTDIVINIVMLAFLALTILPVGWMVFSSLKSSTDIAIGRVGLSRNLEGKTEVHWDNYVDMWKNVNFGLYLKNSLIICGVTMAIAMVFSTLAAYALSRFRFPGSDLFSNALLATQMIPAIMYLIPIYIMFVKFTLMTGIPVKGTYWGIILIYSAFFIPFSIWILRGFFATIPKELEESARIDGCSAFQVFWHIALPLAIPGIIATGIYIFLTAWDELMFAWVLTNSDTMTIPVGIRLFVGNYQNRFDLMMAAATVATLPVVVIFFLLQRHIVHGLTAGAVKG